MSHPERAAAFVADDERVHWHDAALWWVRQRRDVAAAAVPDWERLRELAAAIKAHTLARLPEYLERFEANALRLGARVHWARDAAEHNEIVLRILRERGARRVVKSKSMLTEECGLNPFLEARGIEVVDTDLGERIVQLRREPPSHIVFPAIHLRRGEIAELFAERLPAARGLPADATPPALVEAARSELRESFLEAEAGLTGVNFAVAETGGIVVCTNEGNADLGTALPPLHIASLGIEKLVPRVRDLAVFLRLLARSATGQALTAYTSHFHGPRPGAELHLVLVDNGRSRLLADPELRRSLACIRCGACLTTCPVYRRSGGHSYGTAVAGPIGSVLEPGRDPVRHASLPFACSLCGSCAEVCPVRIPLPRLLLARRRELVERGRAGLPRTLRAALAWALTGRRRFEGAGRLLRAGLRGRARAALGGGWNAWARGRELPDAPARSFRERWAARRAGIDAGPGGGARERERPR